MHEYKKEANFKKLLSTIKLEDVGRAVWRAKKMNESTIRGGARTAEYCGFSYCLGNPYTDIWVPVENMLKETHALPDIDQHAR